MKSNIFSKVLLAGAIATASFASQAAVEVYNADGISVALDASFNAFHSSHVTDTNGAGDNTASRDQARIRSGFLPNWFGTTFSKDMGGFKLAVGLIDPSRTATDGAGGVDAARFRL